MSTSAFISGLVASIRDQVVATLPGIPVVGGVGFNRRSLAVGVTPNDTLYEFNSGGQNVFQDTAFHLATMDKDIIPMKIVLFNGDTGKPVGFQMAVNRGDGIPGSPTFSRAAQIGDRALILDWYVGRGEAGTGVATDQQTAFSHAGYLTSEVEKSNNGENETATHVELRPGADVGFPGNGIELNSLAQAGLAGPNRLRFGPQQNHKAILILGPGGNTVVPLRLTPAALKSSAEEGGLELDAAGVFYVTQGLTGSLKRRAVETNQVSAAITPSGAASGGSTVTASVLGNGMGWAKVLLTVSGADYTTVGGAVASLEFATAFDAVPIVVGSRDAHNGTSGDGGHEFAFNGRATNRISISMMSGTLLNGQTYCFNLLWKVP